MPVFEYEVVDQRGTLGRGSAEAEDQGDLIQQLRGQGQLVLSVRRAPAGSARAAGGGRFGLAALTDAWVQAIRSVSSGVPLVTLVLFTGQLAAMLEAGVHLVRILSAVAREATNRKFRAVIDDIRESVTAGATLADSLNQHPNVFGRLYVAVVRAGEQSGSLPVVLNTLTTYLEKADHLRRKVKGAIAYPLVILSVAIFIVFVMLVKIVPIFEGVYARANAQLPAPTRLLIAVSSVFREYTVFAVLAVVVAVVLAYMGLQTPRGRYLRDAAVLRAPVFGELVRKAIMARVCRTMALLLQSGIPLIDTLETVTQVAGNKVVDEALQRVTQHVRDGEPLADTLRDTEQFPGMVIQLVATGEESGTLPNMLGKAALYYEQQVDNTVATLSSLIEPVLIVVMGAIAGAVVFALYLPIFTLGQAVKGGLR
jgi:type IV pilus assembly protein PilC